MAELNAFLKVLPWGDIISSLLIIVSVLIFRWLITRAVKRRSETLSSEQRKWISITHNVSLMLILILLLAIWSFEISQFAISAAAFAVAIVLASKEIILCFTGGLYRIIARPFAGGDWIEVGAYRGEVLREGLLSTYLQELVADDDHTREYTGRTIALPNGLLLSNPVIDLNIKRNFVFHEFDVTTANTDFNPLDALKALKESVTEAWSAQRDVAERYWSMVRNRSAVDFRKPDPIVQLNTTELGLYVFQVRIFCNRRDTGDVEHAIKDAFFGYLGNRAKATG